METCQYFCRSYHGPAKKLHFLNLEYFIGNRLASRNAGGMTRSFMRLAITAIALGLAVMILSIATLIGFQGEIRDKVTGFGAEIQIDRFEDNASYESKPVSLNQEFYKNYSRISYINHIQLFALKAGMIKMKDQIQGVVLKGIGEDFNWASFGKYITEGEILEIHPDSVSNDVIISRDISKLLGIEKGDDILMYFISSGQAQPRGRRFTVKGIYETGLEDFDKRFVIGDYRHIQKLNSWSGQQVSGFEVFIDDFSHLEEAREALFDEVSYDLNITTITETYPQIFDWLKLLDKNVVVILVLMIAVSGITMISALLVLILERTTMIGILKALGMRNRNVQRIFFYNAAITILKGMVWGNILGISIAMLQQYLKVVPLDPRTYYMSYVPIDLELGHLLLLNAGTLFLTMLIVLIPAMVISRITPLRSIRFD